MEETEKKKIFMLRVIIGSAAFVILILWSFNLKNVWTDNQNNKATGSEWAGLRAELENTLEVAKNKLNQIEADKVAAEKIAGDKFLAGLLENTERKASSSESGVNLTPGTIGTSTPTVLATSSPVESASSSSDIELTKPPIDPATYCPKYIDCMPSISGTGRCDMPPGCEEYSVIAY